MVADLLSLAGGSRRSRSPLECAAVGGTANTLAEVTHLRDPSLGATGAGFDSD
jgi:hypothetical protein